jgi:hypothetical protein
MSTDRFLSIYISRSIPSGLFRRPYLSISTPLYFPLLFSSLIYLSLSSISTPNLYIYSDFPLPLLDARSPGFGISSVLKRLTIPLWAPCQAKSGFVARSRCFLHGFKGWIVSFLIDFASIVEWMQSSSNSISICSPNSTLPGIFQIPVLYLTDLQLLSNKVKRIHRPGHDIKRPKSDES